MTNRLIATIATGAMLVCTHPLAAQRLRGQVVLPDGTTPGRGVIVQAQDDRGTAVARTLTNDRGEFLLALGAPGTFGLQVLRIGFRPTPVPPVTVAAGATVSVRIVLTAEAITLTAVTVRGQDQCRVNPDSGLMVARVWDEARKAILTSALEAQDAPVFAEWIEYGRVLTADGRLVRAQHVRTSRNLTTHAFKSLPAGTLASRGYVVDDTDATTFYAPDADVLLSPSFAESHCFRLAEAPRGRAGLIGVAFEPVRDVPDVRDISGTFWVDRTSAELRSLDFRYTNLPGAAYDANPGGRVEFLRLADGRWLVSRWYVRLPRLRPRTELSDDGGRRTMFAASGVVVRDIQVSGGEVTRVTLHDSVVYEPAGNALRVQVIARDTLVRTAGAVLSLVGTDYTAAADSAGRIVLRPVLEGRYGARVSTALMDTLGIAPVEQEVEVSTGSAHVDSIAVPSTRDLLPKACRAETVRHGEAMLHGTVHDARGQALPLAAVTVTWQGEFTSTGTASHELSVQEHTLGVLTDNAGWWKICGVPRGEVPLAVRVSADSGDDARTVRLADDVGMASVDLVARRGAAAAGQQASRRAIVEFAAMGFGGAALAGVRLDVTEPNGVTRTVVTGEGGRVLMPDLPPGLLRVRARRVGLKPGQIAATVTAGRNTVPILLSEAIAPTLDTVRVVGGKRVTDRLDEFETRRLNHMATASFGRDDIEKVNPVDTWQMLGRVSAMKLMPNGNTGGLFPVSNRGMQVGSNGAGSCYMSVMIDGLIMLASPPDSAYDVSRLPPPEDIHGIEVFAGPASIPPQYNGAGGSKMCGLIAIWTR